MLIVDDSAYNLFVMEELMGQLGVQADTALNGQLALNKVCASRQVYDVIFLDIHMPVLDGY